MFAKVITDRERYENAPPWWYGVAYQRWETREVVCVVIPFNFLVGWVVDDVYPFLRHGPRRPKSATNDAYDRGFKDGLKEGQGICRESVDTALAEMKKIKW